MPAAVSIIIPIYNVEKYLDQCLQSVAEQTLKDIEVICVNDGSTDSSLSIIKKYTDSDDRFVLIDKENGGYGHSINRGLEKATSTYIGIVEPDDYIDTTMYEKLYAASRDGSIDIVKSAYWRVCEADTADENLIPAFYYDCVKHVDEPFTLDQEAEFIFHHPSIWTAIYRRAFLEEKNIHMHEIPGAGWADNPWLIETLAQADSIVYINEMLYYYREFNLGSSSIVKDPSIIYDRWLDMDKIVRQLDITSPLILEGHYNRGCAYIEMLNEDFDTNDPQIKDGISKIIERMDYNAIYESTKIPSGIKDAYQSHIPFLKRLSYRRKRK